MEDDARETAIAKLAELLKHPDDLNTKVGPLARKIAKEKATIEAQLNTGVQSQLNHVQHGLETLSLSATNNGKVKSDMRSIDELCSDARSTIDNFSLITKVSRVHEHFVATIDKVKSFRDLERRLDDIEHMFEPMQSDPLFCNDDLLHVHYHLFKLEEFRDETVYKARDSQHDVIITLKKYFRRVDILSDDFTRHLWFLTRNLLSLVDQGCGPTIVKLVKIIECEERADEKALAARQSKTNLLEDEKRKNWFMTSGSPRTIKSLRVEFFEQLHASTLDRFEQELKPFKESNDWDGALENTEFIFDDLELIYDQIVPKFPKRYKIFPYFVLEYHRHTYNLLNDMVKQNLNPADILRLLRFVRNYYATMSTRLGVTEELLEPQLLDGQEQQLVDEYLKLARGKMAEWTANIAQAQSRNFVKRDEPLEETADGHYILSGSVDLFQIIHQQIDVASEANQGKLLYLVVSECCKVMKDSQQFWKQLLAVELRKQLEEQDAPSGFVEYAMALANDQYSSINFTRGISKRVMIHVDAKYRDLIEDRLTNAEDGYQQIVSCTCDALVDIVFNDVLVVFNSLFCDEWYQDKDNEMMESLVTTFREYFDDFQKHLDEDLFRKLLEDALDRFLMQYLKAMRNRKAVFRKDEACEKIEMDMKLAFGLFAQYFGNDKSYIEDQFDVIEKVHTVIESDRNMVFVDYYALRQAYSDVPLGFVEDILSKRDDLGKAALKDIIEGIKAKAREYEPDTTMPPTIFSRIKW